MECFEAQQLISAAYDKETVDAAALEQAKAHCRDCVECVEFVRGLAALQAAALPQPPDGLAERVAAQARAQVDAERAAAASGAAANADGAVVAAVADSGTEPSSVAGGAAVADATSPAARRARIRWNDPATLGWLATAAAVLLIAGWAAIAGVRTILLPRSASAPTLGVQEGATKDMAAPESLGGATGGDERTAAPSDGGAQSTANPQYVVIDGTAYRLTGAASESTATLQSRGTVVSSLDSSGTPAARPAWSSPTGDRVLVADDNGQLLAFVPVTRQYQGTTYVLKSGPIAGFGMWPTLPPDIPPPTAQDGSPTFSELTQETGGATIYRLSTGTPQQGIGVGPNAGASDPGGGNPNWTWWTPQ